MNLNANVLQNILTEECFHAVDVLSARIGLGHNPELAMAAQDQIFRNMSSALHKVVMLDGVVDEAARHRILKEMIDRTVLLPEFHFKVDQAFILRLQKNASDSLNEVLDGLKDNGVFSQSYFKDQSGYLEISDSLFYGEWMAENTLRAPLEAFQRLQYTLNLTTEEKALYKNQASDKQIQLITTWLLERNPEAVADFNHFVAAFKDHEKFPAILRDLSESPFRHRDVSYSDCLTPETHKRLSHLQYEVREQWEKFLPQRSDMLSCMFGELVARRCSSLITHMSHDLEGAFVEVQEPSVGELNKNSIATFRGKENTENHGVSPTGDLI